MPISGLPRCKVQVFTASGTWVRPPGVQAIHVLAVGGGGGGAGVGFVASTARMGAGGGGGQVLEQFLPVTGNVTVTIGAFGAGGTAGNNNGAAGSNTTLTGGASLTALGGHAGQGQISGAASNYTGTLGGQGNGEAYRTGPFALGSTFQVSTSATYSPNVNAMSARAGTWGIHNGQKGFLGYGGGGGGFYSAAAASSTAGVGQDGGGNANSNANGSAATANTGGGGGGGGDTSGTTNRAGGNGADGLVIITWWE